MDTQAYQIVKIGLAQLTNEALQRILDHEGEMLLDGSIIKDGIG